MIGICVRRELGLVHTCNPSIEESGVGGSLGYVARPYLERTRKKERSDGLQMEMSSALCSLPPK